MSMLNVGDAVLYTKNYGAHPVAGIVIKVTKTQARVALADEDGTMRNPATEVGPFKREAFNGQHEVLKSGSYRTYSAVWAKTDEVEKQLNETADKAEKAAAEKKDAEANRQQEYAKQLATELAEVKVAFGYDGGSELPTSDRCSKTVMPDGSRIYTVDIPVKPCYTERKGGWERVIVRCKSIQDYDWKSDDRKTVTKIECAYTYVNGSSSSFSSCGSDKFDKEEDAVWEAIRSQYHRW